MKNVTIKCGHCKGRGKVELTGVYAETLALVRGLAAEVAAVELAREVGCRSPAMSNRLAYLERRGLLSSRRYGRKRLYKAKGKA